MLSSIFSPAGHAQWECVTEGRDAESAGTDFWSGQRCTFFTHLKAPYVFVFSSIWHTLSVYLPLTLTHADCLPTGFGPVSEKVCVKKKTGTYLNEYIIYLGVLRAVHTKNEIYNNNSPFLCL